MMSQNNSNILSFFLNEKKTLGETQTLPKNFAPPQTPFQAQDGKNLIS